MYTDKQEFIKDCMKAIPKDLAAFDVEKIDFLNFQKETRSKFLWNKLLEYVQNRQKKGMFSKYIAIQRWRKEIYDFYEKCGETKKLMFESQNVFKWILIEKILIPYMIQNQDGQDKLDMCTIYAELINDKDLFIGKLTIE